jgi:hypothetical protein
MTVAGASMTNAGAYRYGLNGSRKTDARIVIPADVQRVVFSEPCLNCGAARECAHRQGVA